MCGIAGIYDPSVRSRLQLMNDIRKMTSGLVHRGPDDCGFYVDRYIALGHQRLSIIDLATGRQPMVNEHRDTWIIFNGEIYNYRDLRAELLTRGHSFSTNSDTEVILHAYEEWGLNCLPKLTGMFAFCIWDRNREILFIARDRLGEKPLFYSHQGQKLLFASEMKAILEASDMERVIDEEALASYFLLSYIPAPLTIYKGIRKLLPGHYALFRNGQLTIHQYWDVNFEPNYRKTESHFIRDVTDLMRDAVRQQLISDVPVGAFLSGGIDSSTVVSLMSSESKEPVRTFTIGFTCDAKGYEDERYYARLVADRYQTDHHEYMVTPQVDGILGTIARAFDEPFADDSTIPSYFVCQMARKNVTVALSGLGGDEAFGGYSRYVGYQLSNIYNKLPTVMRDSLIGRLADSVPVGLLGERRVDHLKRFVRATSRDDARRYLGFVSKLPERYLHSLFSGLGRKFSDAMEAAQARLLRRFNEAPADNALNKFFYCDMKTYLPDDILACSDRMSMQHSLEVRVPFLNHHLVEYSATIPPDTKLKLFQHKYLLKKCVAHLLPSPVLRHRKRGFVGPLDLWLKRELRALTEEKLAGPNLAKHGLFNQQTVRTILDDHYTDRESNDTLIWSLLVFQIWSDAYMG